MKAKIIKKLTKNMGVGLDFDKIYTVEKIADDNEGVWLVNDFHNKVFISKKFVELFHEDGVTKYEAGIINVSFGGLLPKKVFFDNGKMELVVNW